MSERLSDFWNTDAAKQMCETMRCVPNDWTYGFMHDVNRIMPMIGVESVIIRSGKDRSVEILLTQRSKDDPDWPEHFHVPGSTLRKADFTVVQHHDDIFRNALYRIWREELRLSEQVIAGFNAEKCESVPWVHKRGPCVSQVFLCVVKTIEFPVGKFYPIDELPEPFLGGQQIIVESGRDSFRSMEQVMIA